MQKTILKIGGMSCSACSVGLEKYLNKQKGIHKATVNLVLQQAFIEYEGLTLKDLDRFVEEAGFTSLGVYDPKKEENGKKKSLVPLIVFGVLAVFTLYISMGPMVNLPTLPYLDPMKYPLNYTFTLLFLTLIFFMYGKDIFQSGVKNLYHKTPNMDTLVSMGVIASFGYSLWSVYGILNGNHMLVHDLYFKSCVMILFFIKLGRYIDSKSKEKTKEALKELVQITPSMALLKEGKETKEVTLDEITKGAILVGKTGMKIAVDGVITKGTAYLDEAFITGESMPSKKGEGDTVLAGSILVDGMVEYEAKRIGKDSTISEIVRLVVEATNTKAPIQKLADQVSSYFVPTIMGLALLTLIGAFLLGNSFQNAFTSFVSVLVVACPCALGLATPLAMVVSEGRCAKEGILIKQNETLEKVQKIDTVVFDKTGTLTYGRLKIAAFYKKGTVSDQEILNKVIALEKNSTHPIASAFIEKEGTNELPTVTDFHTIEGIGLSGKIGKTEIQVGNNKLLSKLKLKNPFAKEEEQLSLQGNSLVYYIENKKVIALFGVRDVVRENAKKTITALKNQHKQVILLTGDHPNTATIVSKEVGMDKVIADVLPQEKTKVIQDLIKEGHQVMMVGDGINDAPSLALSDVGVSIHSGTDIAADSSDVILMQDNLEKIPLLFTISKKTMRNIKQNLFWAFFYNMAMIPIAMGFFRPLHIEMNPMFAGLAMTISSLTVVFNSLRLRK